MGWKDLMPMELWHQIFEYNALHKAYEDKRIEEQKLFWECVEFYDVWIDHGAPGQPLRSSLTMHARYNYLFDQLQECVLELQLLHKEVEEHVFNGGRPTELKLSHTFDRCVCRQCLLAAVTMESFLLI